MARLPRQAIDAAGFETKFQGNIDPWNYAGSRFEAFKRSVLLQACGHRPYARGLELACAIGETTKALRPLCLNLLALDASPTALEEAQRRTAHLTHVEFRQGLLPNDLPSGTFDLIVASEIVYYLPPRDMERLLIGLKRRLAARGRIVLLHHTRDFGDAAFRPSMAQAHCVKFLGQSMVLRMRRNTMQFQAVAFEARKR